MTTNSQLSANEPKRKKNNQNRNRTRDKDITWWDFSGEGEGRNRGEKVQGRRSIISRHKIDGRDKNGIGNRELKELICTIHGYELRGGDAGVWAGRVEGG